MTAWLLFGLLLQRPVSAMDEAARLFERGVTPAEFFAAAHQQRDLWTRNVAGASAAPALVERLARAGRGMQFLVVAEDWCPDSVNTVPYLALLADSAHVGLRIVDRKDGESAMRAHRSP